MDLTVASLRRSVALRAEASFRRREHAPRLAEHRGPARKSGPRSIRSWSTNGSRRRASFPDERAARSITGRPRTALSSPIMSLGEGRPVVLLHGLFSDAEMNWIKFGHADADCRGGLPGDHARPSRPRAQRKAARSRILSARDPRAGPARAGRASRAADFDLGGFSLGARTTVEAVGEGLRPRRAILAARGSRACATGSGASISSSRRSSCSTGSSAATRTGCRSSS